MKYRKIDKAIRNYIMRKYSYVGIVSALVFFCFSLLPSLMPRTWLLQAIVSGLSLAFGYGVGLLISILARKSVKKNLPMGVRRVAWHVFVYSAPVIVIVFLYLGSVWQEELRGLLQFSEEVPFRGLRVFVVAMVIATSIIWVSSKIKMLGGWLIGKLDAHLPFRLSLILGVGITVFLVFWVASGVFFNFFETWAYRTFRAENDTTPENIVQPTSENLSGSEASYVAWEDLGRQGRRFIGTAPAQDHIASYYNDTTLEPIRVYVGYDAAATAQKRADIALRELQRTNAFERKVLVIATPTGTGWLEPKAVDVVEYMHGGDTAIVAQQYSYLPSWASFLIDKDVASETGRILFDTVYAEWLELPEDERPELYTYGLSLGAYGSQAAFSGVDDMLNSIDGAMYQGTLNDTAVWRKITDERDAGSPEWQPQYEGGESVRFASSVNDTERDVESWQSPRVLYMQHASDPIVWFSFDLIVREPDWLKEAKGPEVSSVMRWYPFVTFIQVAVDQAAAHTVTEGRGHLYGDTVVESWRAVTQPEPWSAEHKERMYFYIHDR